MVTYEIIHKLKDGTESVIGEVKNPAYIRHYVETPQYPGTWISDTRKLLRFGRGEIYIKTKEEPPVEAQPQLPLVVFIPENDNSNEKKEVDFKDIPRQQPLTTMMPQGIDDPKPLRDIEPKMIIVDKQFIKWTSYEVCKLTLANSKDVCWIVLTPTQIIAFTPTERELWRYFSFSEMAERFDRNIAYEALQIYESYVKTYNYPSAM